MGKAICILLACLLLTNLAFANPQSSAEMPTEQLVFIGVLTLGIGLLIYHIIAPPVFFT